MKVAAVQLNSSADRAANLDRADELTRSAAAAGAQLIVLPEKWTAMGAEADLRARRLAARVGHLHHDGRRLTGPRNLWIG